MKRFSLLLAILAMWSTPAARAQDAATQERLDKLTGRIEDLTAAQESLKKQITELNKELGEMREQATKPNTTYVRPEDLNRLAESIKEVDRKRINDADKIQAEFQKLRKVLDTPPPSHSKPPVAPTRDTGTSPVSSGSATVYQYVIKSGDTLEAIAQAYRDKNVKVTTAQILKANPGLKAERLVVGKKIDIPMTQP